MSGGMGGLPLAACHPPQPIPASGKASLYFFPWAGSLPQVAIGQQALLGGGPCKVAEGRGRILKNGEYCRALIAWAPAMVGALGQPWTLAEGLGKEGVADFRSGIPKRP